MLRFAGSKRIPFFGLNGRISDLRISSQSFHHLPKNLPNDVSNNLSKDLFNSLHLNSFKRYYSSNVPQQPNSNNSKESNVSNSLNDSKVSTSENPIKVPEKQSIGNDLKFMEKFIIDIAKDLNASIIAHKIVSNIQKIPLASKITSDSDRLQVLEKKLESVLDPIVKEISNRDILMKYFRFYRLFFFLSIFSILLSISLYFSLIRQSYPEWVIGLLRTLDSYITLFSIIADYKFSLKDTESMDENERYNLLSNIHTRSAYKLLNLCFRNGGIYIKAGQFASSLNNVLPLEYCDILQACQDKVPVQFKSVKDLICKELGINDLSDVFSSFNENAVAAASLAQVYKATLHNGDTVAVKVQHPKLDQTVKADVVVFKKLVALTEYFFPDLKLMWILNEFDLVIPNELNFTVEANNNEEFSRVIASKFSNIRTPKVYWEYTRPKILVMEFIENGYKVNDSSGLHYIGADKKYLSNLLLNLFSEQIFVEGFCHADLHPGNMLVIKNPKKQKGIEVIVLDHGLYTRLSEDMRLAYSELWLGLIMRNKERVLKASLSLGIPKEKCDLFSVILTNRSWNDSDIGISSSLSQKEQRELLKYASDNFFNITQVLSEIDRRFLLLLKTNDLLRNMQAFLGTYVNYFSVFAENAQKTVNKHRVNESKGFIKKWYTWARGIFELYLLRISLFIYMRLKLFQML